MGSPLRVNNLRWLVGTPGTFQKTNSKGDTEGDEWDPQSEKCDECDKHNHRGVKGKTEEGIYSNILPT